MEEWNLIPKNKDDHIGCLTDRLQLWYSLPFRIPKANLTPLARSSLHQPSHGS